MKRNLPFFVMFFLSTCLYAQIQIGLKGNIINYSTNEPLSGVLVTIKGQNQTTVTDARGEFYFNNIVSGEDILNFSSSEIISKEMSVNISDKNVTELKDVRQSY